MLTTTEVQELLNCIAGSEAAVLQLGHDPEQVRLHHDKLRKVIAREALIPVITPDTKKLLKKLLLAPVEVKTPRPSRSAIDSLVAINLVEIITGKFHVTETGKSVLDYLNKRCAHYWHEGVLRFGEGKPSGWCSLYVNHEGDHLFPNGNRGNSAKDEDIE